MRDNTSPSGQTDVLFLRVTIQVVATWHDKGELRIALLGRCEPDHGLMSRSRFIRQSLAPRLPAAWSN